MLLRKPSDGRKKLRWRQHLLALGQHLLVLALMPLVALALAARRGPESPSGAFAAFADCPEADRKGGPDDDEDPEQQPSWLAVSTDQKLLWLIDIGVTSAEIALSTGSPSVRAVEERRRALREGKVKERYAKLDPGIDALFSIVSMLERRHMEPRNIRAWLLGLSPYLEEQRPAVLLSANEFELVRAAALAFASNETPEEFLKDRDQLPRPAEPAEVQ